MNIGIESSETSISAKHGIMFAIQDQLWILKANFDQFHDDLIYGLECENNRLWFKLGLAGLDQVDGTGLV